MDFNNHPAQPPKPAETPEPPKSPINVVEKSSAPPPPEPAALPAVSNPLFAAGIHQTEPVIDDNPELAPKNTEKTIQKPKKSDRPTLVIIIALLVTAALAAAALKAFSNN